MDECRKIAIRQDECDRGMSRGCTARREADGVTCLRTEHIGCERVERLLQRNARKLRRIPARRKHPFGRSIEREERAVRLDRARNVNGFTVAVGQIDRILAGHELAAHPGKVRHATRVILCLKTIPVPPYRCSNLYVFLPSLYSQ